MLAIVTFLSEVFVDIEIPVPAAISRVSLFDPASIVDCPETLIFEKKV